MKRGVLGGTFDPVHNGHLMVAEEVRAQLNLDEVVFLPAGQPWWKAHRKITPAEHRLRMLELALDGKPYFKVSTSEVRRKGPTYAIDTITEMRTQLSSEDEIYFIIGWDVVAEFPLWREPSRLLEMCRLTAVPRPGFPKPDVNALEAKIPGVSRRLVLLDKPEVDISATVIRQRVAQGLPISGLVPEAVEKYIKRYRLYERN